MSQRDRLGAVPTRIRQEVEKRVRARLVGEHGGVASDAALGLTDARTPPRWAEDVIRPREGPHDAAAVVAEADEIVAGRFSVFGRRLPAFERTGDWRADPLTGAATGDGPWFAVPFHLHGSDVKVYWELNRHHALLRLAQAWRLTGEARYAQKLGALIGSWIDQDEPGAGLNWASSIEVGFRAATWCWIWALSHDAAIWDDALLRRFLDRLRAHAVHVDRYDSSHHSPNTHLTGEALGLLYVGETFPRMRGATRWQQRGRRILIREIDRQILPDGMHFERSTCYHRYTLEFYLHFMFLAGPDDADAERLRRTVGLLANAADCLRRPDRSWPVLGDDDGGRFLRLGADEPADANGLLAAAAAATGFRPDEATRDSAEAWWMPMPDPTPGRELEASAALPHAGYFGRPADGAEAGSSETAGGGPTDGWWLLVDAGPLGVLGGGHGHADLGHVELSYGTRPVVTDSGCGVYGADPELRDWFRSERAHARPVVSGRPLAVEGDPFSWKSRYEAAETWMTNSDGLWHFALRSRLGYDADGVVHSRQLLLLPDAGLVVLDWFDGDGDVRGSVRWPLASDAEIDEEGTVVTAGVRLRGFGLGDGCRLEGTRLEHGFRSPSYGVVEDGWVADMPFDGSAPCGVVSTFSSEESLLGSARMTGPVNAELTLTDALGGDVLTTTVSWRAAPVARRSNAGADQTETL